MGHLSWATALQPCWQPTIALFSECLFERKAGLASSYPAHPGDHLADIIIACGRCSRRRFFRMAALAVLGLDAQSPCAL